MNIIKEIGAYLIARLSEASTWLGVVTAITGAAALENPFNYMAIAAGVIAALAKEKK